MIFLTHLNLINNRRKILTVNFIVCIVGTNNKNVIQLINKPKYIVYLYDNA